MKVEYVQNIMEDIIDVQTKAITGDRQINLISLTKEEAEEFDILMIEKGMADPKDKLVRDGVTVLFNGVPVTLMEETYVH